ncbi:MAG: hypothetical protein VYA69_02790 [Gemmatimonadota bacterium]|nr:hypothetical protein [Gemmatimonadota bacterium]
MSISESRLRILLLQIRQNPKVRREEHDSFVRYSGLDASQIHNLNVFDTSVSVHRERAQKAPDTFETLAYTDLCCHAFRIPAKPFWAFQFHPEMNRENLIERLTIYKDEYTENVEHLGRILASVQETPESNVLIRKFVERVWM